MGNNPHGEQGLEKSASHSMHYANVALALVDTQANVPAFSTLGFGGLDTRYLFHLGPVPSAGAPPGPTLRTKQILKTVTENGAGDPPLQARRRHVC